MLSTPPTPKALCTATSSQHFHHPARSGEGARLRHRYTQDPEAYDAYLRGRATQGNFDVPAKLEQSRKEFELALQRDPNYAPALAGLA
jgi:hypothetical protein